MSLIDELPVSGKLLLKVKPGLHGRELKALSSKFKHTGRCHGAEARRNGQRPEERSVYWLRGNTKKERNSCAQTVGLELTVQASKEDWRRCSDVFAKTKKAPNSMNREYKHKDQLLSPRRWHCTCVTSYLTNVQISYPACLRSEMEPWHWASAGDIFDTLEE